MILLQNVKTNLHGLKVRYNLLYDMIRYDVTGRGKFMIFDAFVLISVKNHGKNYAD